MKYTQFEQSNGSSKLIRHLAIRHLNKFSRPFLRQNHSDTGPTLFIWYVTDSNQFWQASTREIMFASLARMTAWLVNGLPKTTR